MDVDGAKEESDTDLLRHTWQSLRTTLPLAHSEVQRAAAEVWGSALRRMKAGQRERSVGFMFETLNDVEDGDSGGVEDVCAWAVVYACKVCWSFLFSCGKLTRDG